MKTPFVISAAVLCLGTIVSCSTSRNAQDTPEVVATPEPPLFRYEFNRPEMGVPFRIVLYAPDEIKAKMASEAAFDRVAHLNDILSDYETDSELNKLSRTSGSGREVAVSDDLWAVLQRAQKLAERSYGAFDITVGPCIGLWRRARRTKQMPDPVLLAKARLVVGYEKLRLNPKKHTALLEAKGMKLDLGGIAKGYAVDQALKVLRTNGITRALVAGAGDMAVSNPPPGKEAWQIEIAPIDAPGAPPARSVLLTHAAIATSGDLFQRLEIDGKRYSHIVDPRTCIGLTDHSLVTVIATNCTTADSLATTVSVLGPKNGLQLVERTPGAEAHIARQPVSAIEVSETIGFGKFYKK